MSLARLRHSLRSRPWAWLLALALWLPAAQWAAATHALLHLHTASAGDRDAATHSPSSCDLCLVAAAVGGAAPAPTVATLLPAAPPQPRPQWLAAIAPRSAELPAYRSRAPPSLHA